MSERGKTCTWLTLLHNRVEGLFRSPSLLDAGAPPGVNGGWKRGGISLDKSFGLACDETLTEFYCAWKQLLCMSWIFFPVIFVTHIPLVGFLRLPLFAFSLGFRLLLLMEYAWKIHHLIIISLLIDDCLATVFNANYNQPGGGQNKTKQGKKKTQTVIGEGVTGTRQRKINGTKQNNNNKKRALA